MHCIGGRKLFECAAFAIEQLQHHHARDVLLQKGVDAGNRYSDATIRVAHFGAKDHGGPKNQGQHGESDERQLPVHAQHDGQDTGQHKHVFKNRHHPGSEHFVQCVHVGGDARDQSSHRILVVKANVHLLEVTENLAAQIEHYFLSGPLHEIGLQEFEAETKHQQADVDRRNLRDPNQRSAAEPPVKWRVRTGRVREVIVDRDLCEKGPQNVGPRLHDDGRKRNRHLPLVGTQVFEQPLHQPAVICFA